MYLSISDLNCLSPAVCKQFVTFYSLLCANQLGWQTFMPREQELCNYLANNTILSCQKYIIRACNNCAAVIYEPTRHQSAHPLEWIQEAVSFILNADYQPVVYLSHDDSHGHGFILGSDFQDFIRRWSHIGQAGGEDWKWMPFVNDPDSLLDSNGKNARIWRESLGLRGQ